MRKLPGKNLLEQDGSSGWNPISSNSWVSVLPSWTPGNFSPPMPTWSGTLCDPLLPHRDPQDSPSTPCLPRAHIVLCFYLVKFYEIPALGSFTSTAIIISQDSTHYKDPEELDDPALPVRTCTFRHSHIFLPEDLDQDKKNQSTLAIISLQISQVQWLVWRTVQTTLVSGSCQPRKKSCAICSEFIKCKILFPSLLFSCPPGRQNPRGSINKSTPLFFLILSSFALFLFFLLFPSSPPPSPSFLSLSTWKTDFPERSVVTMTENERYLLVENFPRMNQKFSYPFFWPESQFSRVSKTFPRGFGSCLILQYWRSKKPYK